MLREKPPGREKQRGKAAQGGHGGLCTTVDATTITFFPSDVAVAFGVDHHTGVPAFVEDIQTARPHNLVAQLLPADAQTDDAYLKRAELPPDLLLVDWVFKNITFGHKDERRKTHLRLLASFHTGAPVNVPVLIFHEFRRFIKDGGPRTKIPFPYLVLSLLKSGRVDEGSRKFRLLPGEPSFPGSKVYTLTQWQSSFRILNRGEPGPPSLPMMRHLSLPMMRHPPLALFLPLLMMSLLPRDNGFLGKPSTSIWWPGLIMLTE
ncbi:hypothetical protein Vadar_004866 [Vaccinium darrowii]|uniref:Uncharacterized protein n=1 Tax=Vaccinium darrowii TaxID=229202 RepID=A0ACB7Z1Y3_9ERIC|nr:hypothetical protein Vadar_004866 [Vaccinium darrowii]